LKGIVTDDQAIAFGGFGLCGIPEALIAALRDSGVKGLSVCPTTSASTASAWTAVRRAPDQENDFVVSGEN
jgi:acyl CoA:acetate/3-ketoacid CoA transferase alpha subunit